MSGKLPLIKHMRRQSKVVSIRTRAVCSPFYLGAAVHPALGEQRSDGEEPHGADQLVRGALLECSSAVGSADRPVAYRSR
jgi:hypothetical protein